MFHIHIFNISHFFFLHLKNARLYVGEETKKLFCSGLFCFWKELESTAENSAHLEIFNNECKEFL